MRVVTLHDAAAVSADDRPKSSTSGSSRPTRREAPRASAGRVGLAVGIAAMLTVMSGCMWLFEDPDGNVQRSSFVAGETVYIAGGFEYQSGAQYQVSYYDSTMALSEVDVVTAVAGGGGGWISADWVTEGPAGTARCVTYTMGVTPPDTYDPLLPNVDDVPIELLDGGINTYEDSGRTIERSAFDAGAIVYGLLSGYAPNGNYQLAYYDTTGALAETDAVTTDGGGGDANSDWPSHNPVGIAHMVTFQGSAAVPSTYVAGEGLDDVPFSVNQPTGIGIVSARLTVTPEGTLVTWRTAQEIGVAGYDVWAVQEGSGRKVRLNRAMIPARGMGLRAQAYRLGPVRNLTAKTVFVHEVRADGGRMRFPCRSGSTRVAAH